MTQVYNSNREISVVRKALRKYILEEPIHARQLQLTAATMSSSTILTSPPRAPSRSMSIPLSPTVPSPAIPSSRNNPLTLRIYKTLGTTFDDPGSREALEIASSFYAPTPSSSAVKIPTIQTNGLTSPQGRERALDSVTDDEPEGMPKRRTLKGQSASMARKHLKKDLEAQLANGSRRFLEAFGEVDKVGFLKSVLGRAEDPKKLEVLRAHMQEMQVRCDQIQSELDQANSGTEYLLERAGGLRSQRCGLRSAQPS